MTLAVEASRTIDAPLSVVWRIISDLDAYHQHTDTLSETVVVSGEDHGATRRCVDASGASWEESCAIWEPEQRYVIDVDVSTFPTKYRMLFRTFQGTWAVEPADGGTLLTVRFQAELRRIPGVGKLVDRARPTEPLPGGGHLGQLFPNRREHGPIQLHAGRFCWVWTTDLNRFLVVSRTGARSSTRAEPSIQTDDGSKTFGDPSQLAARHCDLHQWLSCGDNGRDQHLSQQGHQS